MRIYHTSEQSLTRTGQTVSYPMTSHDAASAQPAPIMAEPAQVIDFCSRQFQETKAQLQRQIDRLSSELNTSLRFVIDQESDSIIVKIVDPSTDKVIKEIPSAEIQNIKIRIKEAIGVIFDAAV
ncbi:MAG TPA: flagellar protein FlaG [Candidatus Treponema faecavium]|nr:flagellar protein FlaG [Candidatus Treponema faecavium]